MHTTYSFRDIRPRLFTLRRYSASASRIACANRRIAAHGVDGDERALKVELLQELGEGDDLVGLLGDGLLSQDQLGVGGEGRHEVPRGAATTAPPARRRPTGLAVNRSRSRCTQARCCPFHSQLLVTRAL
jgi:hypothetical protein